MTTTAPDYQPYVAGPFRWRLGLRPLALDDWIQVDDRYEAELARKAEVLAAHPATVLSWLPDVEPEATEVLDTLLDHLIDHWPDCFSVSPTAVTNHRTGATHDRTALHPLDLAGRLVQEDLLVMVPRNGRLVFGGGSVCFPNRWDLPSKVGRTMAEVHAPVARLNEQLGDPIDGFFERLRPERPFWRLGWGLLDTEERYQPLDGTAPHRDPAPHPGDPTAPDRLFLRVERETLRRFPRTECVLFTIRTYIRPLRHLAERPDDAARLADALRAMPADVADYKQLEQVAPAATAWLDSVAALSPRP